MSSIVTRHVGVIHFAGMASGRLVVYAKPWHSGTITVYQLDERGQHGSAFYAPLNSFTNGAGEKVKAAVFPQLPPSNYKVIEPGYTTIGRSVTVFPGEVVEVDFR